MANKQLTTPGIYQGTITAWGLQSAGTGTPQWVLTVTVTHRAKNDDDLDAGWDTLPQPLRRRVFNAITTNTVDRVIDEAKSIGFTSTDPRDLDPRLGSNPHNFGGTIIKLSCTHDEYMGKTKERWQLSRRVDNKMTAEAVEQFAALFGDAFKERMEGASQNNQPTEVLF